MRPLFVGIIITHFDSKRKYFLEKWAIFLQKQHFEQVLKRETDRLLHISAADDIMRYAGKTPNNLPVERKNSTRKSPRRKTGAIVCLFWG